jgi:2-keto-3-deoxy-L-rhamnonate aldolase RhmA
MLQVETEVGVENVEKIAAVADVDCICIGYADLSNFPGVPGELKHPKYLGAVERIAAAANKHGRVLATAAPDEYFAKEYAARGVQDVLLRHRCAPAAVGTRPTDCRDAGRRALTACRQTAGPANYEPACDNRWKEKRL